MKGFVTMVSAIYEPYVTNYIVKCSNKSSGWSKEVHTYNFILIKSANVNILIERYNRFFFSNFVIDLIKDAHASTKLVIKENLNISLFNIKSAYIDKLH